MIRKCFSPPKNQAHFKPPAGAGAAGFRRPAWTSLILSAFLLFWLQAPAEAASYTDDLGRALSIGSPRRVVSLSPGATESLSAFNIGKRLAGITMDDSYFECLAGVPAAGPESSPDWGRVSALKPDLLIVPASRLGEALSALGNPKYPVLAWSDSLSPEAAHDRILRLGKIFGREKEAQAAVLESRDYLETIRLKTEKIPPGQRRRVMRLRSLGGGRIGSSGIGSYEAEIIRLAGGIPPDLPGGGAEAPLSPEAFRSFSPQYVYACEKDRSAVESLAGKAPWSAHPELKSVRYFPCALTNRTSAHIGYFTAWLSSDIYAEEYGDPDNFVHSNEIIRRTPVNIKNIPYVKSAEISEYKLFDFPHRTLVITFASPQNVVSSGDGAAWRSVASVGNSGSPPMAWGIHHKHGWEKAQDSLFAALGLDRSQSSLIFTGADLRGLAVKTEAYKDLSVTALATAGADGNALRTSKDAGAWHQPGTINIILLSSRALTEAGAASAIIVATEAKTAALWDMDIRSTETPKSNPATGTGTDDIIVVMGGSGAPLDYTGGHSKIGELIAKAVYEAVREALLHHNGKSPVRPVWLRLAERGIQVGDLGPDFEGGGSLPGFRDEFLKLLLEPRAQALLEAAFALDDAHIMGEFSDVSVFSDFAAAEASLIAGRNIGPIRSLVADKTIPPALTAAINALGTALLVRSGL